MIELDVQLTRDGEVVVMHDFTLDRTTDGAGAVATHTAAEIRRLDAGTWFDPAYAGEPVPSLAEVLARVPIAINVELKPVGSDGLEGRVLAVVEDAGALDRVVFSSFEGSVLQRLRACSAKAEIAVLWELDPIEGAIARAQRIGATALHLRKDAMAPASRAAAERAGLMIRLWTVNEPKEIGWPEAPGIDSVFTDYPERFLHTPGPP